MSVATKHAYRFGYLKSEEWGYVRAEVLARDNATCAICSIRSLSNDVHHYRYPRNIWDTTASYCVTLCRECHDTVHDNATGKLSIQKAKELILRLKSLHLKDACQICRRSPDWIIRKVVTADLRVCNSCWEKLSAVPQPLSWKMFRKFRLTAFGF